MLKVEEMFGEHTSVRIPKIFREQVLEVIEYLKHQKRNEYYKDKPNPITALQKKVGNGNKD